MLKIPDATLWIGNRGDLGALDALYEAGIIAVVDVAFEERPVVLPRAIAYCRFPISDDASNDPRVLRIAVETVAGFLNGQLNTLVVCGAGMSRSPTIAAAGLAVQLSEPPTETVRRIQGLKALDLSPAFWNSAQAIVRKIRAAE